MIYFIFIVKYGFNLKKNKLLKCGGYKYKRYKWAPRGHYKTLTSGADSTVLRAKLEA